MSVSATDPRRIEHGEAPFMPGDRVIYRPRPAGPEIVELVEYRREGWGGWYVGTSRQLVAHRYDRVELFDRIKHNGSFATASNGAQSRSQPYRRAGYRARRRLAAA